MNIPDGFGVVMNKVDMTAANITIYIVACGNHVMYFVLHYNIDHITSAP